MPGRDRSVARLQDPAAGPPIAKDRAKVVPRASPVAYGRPALQAEPRELDPCSIPRLNRLPWAVLLKRVFLVDVLERPKCRARMRVLAAVTAPVSIRRILMHLGLRADEPQLTRAHPPPNLRSRGRRRDRRKNTRIKAS